MPRMTQAQFAQTDGFQCPVCLKRNTMALDGPKDVMGDVTWEIECHDCGSTYEILLVVSGFNVTLEGDDPEVD